LQQSLPALNRQTALGLAEVTVIFTNGLWTMSRNVSDATILRHAVGRFLRLISDGKQ
jgi:TetR/AcrR family transcriptional repressor of nem operon